MAAPGECAAAGPPEEAGSEAEAIELLAKAFAGQEEALAKLKEEVSRLEGSVAERDALLEGAAKEKEALSAAVEQRVDALALQVDFQILFEQRLHDVSLLKASLKAEARKVEERHAEVVALQKRVQDLTFEADMVSTYRDEMARLSSVHEQEREAMEAARADLQRELAAAVQAKDEAARVAGREAEQHRRSEMDLKNRLMKSQVEIDRLRSQAGAVGTAQRKRAGGKLALAAAPPKDKRAKPSGFKAKPGGHGRLPRLELDECWGPNPTGP